MSGPVVIGIESSCDETAIGIVRGRELLANVISSSVDEHAKFGGVVPEIASRAHLESILGVLESALSQAEITLAEVDAFGVTAGPGLIGALLVGTSTAAGLALATGKPLYGVNHLAAHIAVDRLDQAGHTGGNWEQAIGLLVSGGHSSILQVNELTREVITMGETIDDAAGEAFDKIARILELDFPGGPSIDRLARSGDENAIAFPRGLAADSLDFSFSGLKTAVARYLAQTPAAKKADVAASFQLAVVEVLIDRAFRVVAQTGHETLVIAGGVAANSRLRALATARAEAARVRLQIPPITLCTDNGAMVAALTCAAATAGVAPSQPALAALSTTDLNRIVWP